MTRFIGARSNRLLCGASFAVACLMLVAIGCKPGDSAKPKEKESASKEDAKTDKSADKNATKQDKPITGREVFARMLDAYRSATSYSDNGVARLSVVFEGEESGKYQKPHTEESKFALAFVRPNKVRIQSNGAEIICDGKRLYGYVPYLADQLLSRPAPKRLTVQSVQPDLIIADALNHGFAATMPQISFLFGKEPLEFFLRDLEDQKMLDPEEVDGHNCYRIRLSGPGGIATFWIDKETYVVRRIAPPTDALRDYLSRQAPVESISVSIDFTNATLNGDVDPKAFQFEAPAGAEMVEFLTPPDIRQLLNKKVPDLKTVDLAGKPIPADATDGKTTVMVFWSTDIPACRPVLKTLEELAKKYKDNPKVAVRAICIDAADRVKADKIEAFLAESGVNLPVARYADKAAVMAFKLGAPPDTFIINDKGIVQHCEFGRNPKYAESLKTKLDKVLAGEEICREQLKEYQEFLDKFKNFGNEQEADAESNDNAAVIKQEPLPEVRIAQRTEPTAFKLAPLWKSREVKNPGNILVVGNKNGPDRLYAIENATAVAELNADGSLIAMHELNLEPGEIVGILRTAVGTDGRRYFAAFLLRQQRCHIFDEKWNLVAHYPEDALKNPHSGIADLQLGDLDGDGKVKLYISYWGVVGVQAVSLDGGRLWKNRSAVSDVGCVVIADTEGKGRRELFCASRSGIVVLDALGQRRGSINVHNRLFDWIVNADLRGAGESVWCGLAPVKLGDNIAVGFMPNGDELWDYTLPPGIQPRPIDPIIAGRLAKNGPGQWLLPGPDGSIHILSADGKLLDKFNYGSALQGLATTQIAGHPALIVATQQGLEAWKVD
jgi:thiol-disulfide isomerase/thioredoxin